MKLKIAIILFITIVAVWLCVDKIDEPTYIQKEVQSVTTSLPVASNATLEQAIINYSIDNNINYNISLRIADCESKMGKYKYNLQGSSAKGIFQFIDSTWANYCQGDVLNDYDNIKCFAKLYKQHKSWWECR